MISKIYSCSVVGLTSELVEIESDLDGGFYKINIVGLPDTSISESKDRISSALKNSGLKLPRNKITINLAPADLKKEGTLFDLPMAICILVMSSQVKNDYLKDSIFVGELALDGRIRHINGALSVAIFVKENGYKNLFLPKCNAKEASLVDGINIYPCESLFQLVNHLNDIAYIKKQTFFNYDNYLNKRIDSSYDFKYIKGQEFTKRALEISASGGHNVLLSGSPGSGKTFLSRATKTILPEMSKEEILEVSKIYSISGLLSSKKPLITERPFRSPHHSSSMVSLVGGGSYPRPGEISLAHRGILFLDEFPEFTRNSLESLRQPLEDGLITISRSKGTLEFPASFILIASLNPCPCGYLGDPIKKCICTPYQIVKYKNKISGPILDRIDMYINVPRVEFSKITSSDLAEESSVIRKRVNNARKIQYKRFKNLSIFTNSEMLPSDINKFCLLDDEIMSFIKNAMSSLNLTARSYNRIIKISRTIADLDNNPNILSTHIAEALQYRGNYN
jgi:magnesium chelatase family protein